MDHKIQVEKKSKKPGCLIALLVILILISAGGLYVMKSGILAAGAIPNPGAAANPSTVAVENGSLSAMIDEVSGIVRSNRSVTLKWKTTGTVAAIHSEIGAKVRKDDVLAELDANTLPVSVLAASVELAQAEEDFAALQNTADKVAAALSDLVTAQKTVDTAKQAVADIDPNLASEEEIRIAYETYLKAQAQFDASKDKFEEVRNADPDNDARQKRIGDVVGYRNARDNALAEYRFYLNGGNALEKEVREAALQLAEATLEQKQQAYEEAKNGPTDAELAAAQAKIAAAQSKIETAKLIAPFDGVVTKFDTKLNDTVTAAQVDTATAVQIDDLSKLFIDIAVSELDISQVKTGQEAEVKFIAIPGKTYRGVVSAIADTGTEKNNAVTFGVTIRLTDADENVLPGLTADIRIPIAAVENANYLPISAVYVEDGQAYVNVIGEDGSKTPLAVELGVKSGLFIEILSDELSAGRTVENFEKKEEETENMPIMFGF